MSKKPTDNQLIQAVKDDRSANSAIQELILRHSGIFISIVSSHFERGNFLKFGLELIQEKDYYIYQAALKYNPSKKTKFSTFLGNEARWLCLNTYNKHKKQAKLFNHKHNNLEFLMKTHASDPDDSLDIDGYEKILDIIRSHKDNRVGQIFELRYVEGKQNKLMPWKNVAKEMNLSIQGCINIHNAAISYVKQTLNKEINYVK